MSLAPRSWNMDIKTIPLYHYNYAHGVPNVGDFCGRFIVENMSSKQVIYTDIASDVHKYATIGSIITEAVGKNTFFWGSGIKTEKRVPPSHSTYLAVRGPLTYSVLKKNSVECPKIFGDPALLLPLIIEKPRLSVKYNIGIIPHFFDKRFIHRESEIYNLKEEATVIDIDTDDITGFVQKIHECEFIISSSLHGVIISHAFGIPAIWMRFSRDVRIGGGSSFKFHDYFLSCGIELYTPPVVNPIKDYKKMLGLQKNNQHLISINNFNALPLIECCPFLNSSRKEKLKTKFMSHAW